MGFQKTFCDFFQFRFCFMDGHPFEKNYTVAVAPAKVLAEALLQKADD